jgi:hypothetical protein
LENSYTRFTIGKETSEFVEISILNYERFDSSNYWDANWLKTRIKIKVGAFKADYSAQLQTTDFANFRNELERIYRDLNGITRFYSLEDWLEIKLTGDGIGHFKLDCKACDFPGTGNTLFFDMQIDQTEIPGLIHQLTSLIEIFPVRGQVPNVKS